MVFLVWMLSMLAANDLVVLLTLLLTDKSKGDSWVVEEASDSKEFPLLDKGNGLVLAELPLK